MKNRFKVNDKIEFLKFGKVIRGGTVTKGPYNIDGVDHYTVKWDYDREDGHLFKMYNSEDIICDLPSAKYRYKLAEIETKA